MISSTGKSIEKQSDRQRFHLCVLVYLYYLFATISVIQLQTQSSKGLFVSEKRRDREAPRRWIADGRKVWAQMLLVFVMITTPQIASAKAEKEASIQVYRTASFQVN